MPSCHSTNDIAKDLCKKPDTKEGAVVITDQQTLGKGQRGNSWESEPSQNLTFSVLIKPSMIDMRQQFYLNIISSLAVKDFLSKLLPDKKVQVKWPNDILVNEKKISGILIESLVKQSGFEWSILGIGLNVNQLDFKNPRATSVKLENSKDYILNDMLENLLQTIEAYYLKLRAQNYSDLKSCYLQSLIGYRQKRSYLAEFEFKGEIIDIKDSGHIVIRSDRRTHEFDFKEVEFLWN